MEKLPRTLYSLEFRQQSVQFFKESGLTLVEAAKRLSLPKGTLKNWVYADRQGELTTLNKHQKPLPEVELELSSLRCKQKRKFKVTTDSKHQLPIAPIY